MNIFILDKDIDKCAEAHVDKHVVKMILESAQMLCTTHWINKYLGDIPRKLESDEWNKVKEQKQNEPRDFPYLPTMHNHPCSIWVRESLDNYEWLYCLAHALNEEYGYRYGKQHKSMRDVILLLPDISIPRRGLTPFVQAMPDALKEENAVQAYRSYYKTEKARLASWTKRKEPEWWAA
jgi:hypothetical protein